MAQWNDAFGVTFNDNDGGVGWRCNPEAVGDVARYHRLFGKWRSRWIFFKRFWRAMMWMESQFQTSGVKAWVFKPEIPE